MDEAIVEARIVAKAENLNAFKDTEASTISLKEHLGLLNNNLSNLNTNLEQRTPAAHAKATSSAKEFETAMHHSSTALGMTGGAASDFSEKLGGIGGLMGASGPVALGAMATTVAFGGVIESFKHGVDSTVELAEATHRLQLESGMSAESASGLISAFTVLGMSTDTAETALFKLGKTAELTPQKLQALGVQIAKNADGSTDLEGTLANVADAYNATGDAAQKDALLFEAFGRSGKDLAVVLDQGRSGLAALNEEARKNHAIINQRDVDDARNYAIAARENKEAWDGFTRSIAMGALPALTEFEARTTHFMQGDFHDMPAALNQEFMEFGKLPAPIAAVAAAHDALTWKTQASSSATTESTKTFSSQAQALKDLQAAMDGQLSKIDNLISAEQAQSRTSDEWARAQQMLTNAHQRVADAQDALNKAIRQYGSNSDQAKTAADNLATAQDNVKSSQDAELTTMLGIAKTMVDLKVKQDDAAGATTSAATKAEIYRTTLANLEKDLAADSPLRKHIDQYIKQLDSIPKDVQTVVRVFHHGNLAEDGSNSGDTGSADAPTAGRGQFAAGGAASGTVLVGENGPELIRLGQRGYVTPNHQLGGGGTVVNITINAQTNATPQEIADAVNRNIMRSLRRNSAFVA